MTAAAVSDRLHTRRAGQVEVISLGTQEISVGYAPLGAASLFTPRRVAFGKRRASLGGLAGCFGESPVPSQINPLAEKDPWASEKTLSGCAV
jgi:hypothetical protein